MKFTLKQVQDILKGMLHSDKEIDAEKHLNRHEFLCLKCGYTDWNIAVRRLSSELERLVRQKEEEDKKKKDEMPNL